MPSFDVVSKVDQQEIANAVNQAQKEVSARYDFKGATAEFELSGSEIKLLAASEDKLEAMIAVLHTKMTRRGVDLRSLESQKIEKASGQNVRQVIQVKEGLDKEKAKLVTKAIKEMKLKVQAQINDNMVRVSAKKIDDLQTVISNLKADESIGLPLQFENMRS